MKTNDLKNYAQHGLNVLLTGSHGTGKTAMIKEVFGEVFGEQYTHWRYFSASTLDPWVDFIGIPKNYTREDGKEVFGIIPPDHFTGDEEIQAIFFDEINRAEEKTLNALMELIQFRSINGRQFPNLKCVWGAENPANDEDNDYMVEELDPAQRDRFDIQIVVPNNISKTYFTKKFGKEITNVASDWWTSHKKPVSPRRLEKILDGYNLGLNLSHYVDTGKVNISQLKTGLDAIKNLEPIEAVLKSGDRDKIREMMTVDFISKNKQVFENHTNIIGDSYKHLDLEVLSVLEKNLKGAKKTAIESYRKNKLKESVINDVDNASIPKDIAEKLTNQEHATDIKNKNKIESDVGGIVLRLFQGSRTLKDMYVDGRVEHVQHLIDSPICSAYSLLGETSFFRNEIVTFLTQDFRKIIHCAKNPKTVFDNYLDQDMILLYSLSFAQAYNGVDVGDSVKIMKKIIGCDDVVRWLGINKAKARQANDYFNGKRSSCPSIGEVFSGNTSEFVKTWIKKDTWDVDV